ncbi:MAG: hypothetical protein FJX46_01170 [Alphaproteobacteria bacterium]|nr:hypothetical protein [Alphaproteobacteria bacterium]
MTSGNSALQPFMNRGLAWAIAAFLGLSVLILALMPRDCWSPVYTRDANAAAPTNYCGMPCQAGCDMARSLYFKGKFVESDDETRIYTDYPPIYGVLVYASLLGTAGSSILPVLVLQVGLLLIWGLMAHWIVERHAPGWGTLAFALVAFNPNAIGIAFLPKTDLVAAVSVSAVLLCLLAYLRDHEAKWMVLAGIMFGIANNTRTAGQLLVLTLPVAMPLLVWIDGHRDRVARTAGLGLAATLIALAIQLPWLMHIYRVEGSLGMQSLRNTHQYQLTIYNVLSSQRDGLPLHQHLGDDIDPFPDSVHRAADPSWDSLDYSERYRRRNAKLKQANAEFSWRLYPYPLAYSTLRFFFTGGEGYLYDMLDIPHERDADRPKGGPERVRFMAIKWWARGFALATQALALLGIWYLWRSGRFALLLLCVGGIFYYYAITAMFGWSRFRLQTELPLKLLAVFGCVWLAQFLHRGAAARSSPGS